MKIYWTIQSLPELANLPLEKQQQAWQTCYQKYALQSWQSWGCLGLTVALILVAIAIVGPGFGGLIGGGLGGVIWGITLINSLRPRLKTYVEQHF